MTKTRDEVEREMADADPRTCPGCGCTRRTEERTYGRKTPRTYEFLVCDTTACPYHPANCSHGHILEHGPVSHVYGAPGYSCEECGCEMEYQGPGDDNGTPSFSAVLP